MIDIEFKRCIRIVEINSFNESGCEILKDYGSDAVHFDVLTSILKMCW